jgi:hypothetical protein
MAINKLVHNTHIKISDEVDNEVFRRRVKSKPDLIAYIMQFVCEPTSSWHSQEVGVANSVDKEV